MVERRPPLTLFESSRVTAAENTSELLVKSVPARNKTVDNTGAIDGRSDGIMVGPLLGSADGLTLGARLEVGSPEIIVEGPEDGPEDGTSLGSLLGLEDGTSLDPAVGTSLGFSLGEALIPRLGPVDGVSLGIPVGAALSLG